MQFFRTPSGMLLAGGLIAAVLLLCAAFSLIRSSDSAQIVLVPTPAADDANITPCPTSTPNADGIVPTEHALDKYFCSPAADDANITPCPTSTPNADGIVPTEHALDKYFC